VHGAPIGGGTCRRLPPPLQQAVHQGGAHADVQAIPDQPPLLLQGQPRGPRELAWICGGGAMMSITIRPRKQ
jgi:hypothetical protein